MNETLKGVWFLYESNRVEILTTFYYELKKRYGILQKIFEFFLAKHNDLKIKEFECNFKIFWFLCLLSSTYTVNQILELHLENS